MVTLRPYQTDGIKKIFEAWNPQLLNHKNVLFQMPTGTGKTTVFSEIVRKATIKNKKVLIVVHRIELVEQIADRLVHFGVDAGIISAKQKANPNCDVQVATIQTLSRREYPPADIVIIDECHHSKATTYKTLWKIYPEARFLGVTATPTRINGDGFDDLFEILIPLGKLSFFFDKGYLARIKHLVGCIPDLSRVKQRMRDYDIEMLRNVMLDNSIMANLIDSYNKFAKGKKTIVFAVDVEHSKEIVQRYLNAGVAAAHIDATTPKNERAETLSKFKSGEILVLSNVDIVSEGFDVPDCEAVQLARPTKSLVLYLQQVGRCMRPAAGKDYGLVLDNAGLWLEHGLSYIDRDWSLQATKKSKKENHTPRKVVAKDEEGFLHEINRPVETIGLELTELTVELERLLAFESFLRIAISSEHKLTSAVYRYKDFLISKSVEMSDVEESYCRKRLFKHGYKNAERFLYHIRNEIKTEIADKAKGVK
ncbi:MAG: DEAD/DEAH box helicase [Bacteroidales bacterium]|jgi:superfamily II DNA or RNA helicase|nr:DEAD/DEAH box helicase [Bacteroidales bacterium]